MRSEPHRGVFVPVLTETDVGDIYLARDALESAAVQHVIATLQVRSRGRGAGPGGRAMAEAEAAEDWEAVGRYDLEFHAALVAATGSERLQRMFSTVISETRLCLGVVTAADARTDLVGEHREIATMIRKDQTEQALAVLKKHFEDAVVVTIKRPRATSRRRTSDEEPHDRATACRDRRAENRACRRSGRSLLEIRGLRVDFPEVGGGSGDRRDGSDGSSGGDRGAGGGVGVGQEHDRVDDDGVCCRRVRR